jgi:hypothetical protein
VFGRLHEGGVQFYLWPTTAFFEKHNLQRKGIKTKIYGSLHHFNTGFEGFKQLRFDPDSQTKIDLYVNALTNFTNVHLPELEARASSQRHFDRMTVAYRIEFSLSFVGLPSQNAVQQVYDDLLLALQWLKVPLIQHDISSLAVWNFASTLLAFVKAPDFRWHFMRQQRGEKRKLRRLCAERLAVLRSAFGIADIFTCKYLRQLTSAKLALLWDPTAELALAAHANLSLDERRAAALSMTYKITLIECNDDGELYQLCQELYPTLMFRWQVGQTSTERFMTYWQHQTRRTPSFADAGQLLIICARQWRLHNKAEDFFIGDPRKRIEPQPMIAFN